MPDADPTPTTAAVGDAPGGPGPVEAVLFDFTGVLTTSPFDALADFERRSNLVPGALLRALLGDYAGDGDHPWHRIERGEMAFSDYAAALPALCAAEGIDLDAAAIFGAFGGLVVHEPVVEAVRALRTRGYRTALVTNNVREYASLWRDLVAVDELFDAVVESWEVGVRKPNPAIYRLACERSGVAPERAVFLDDQPANVAGARAAGLRAILVGDPATALAELDALLRRSAAR